MTSFLRKLFGYQEEIPSIEQDNDLTKFFTDTEDELQIFEQMVRARDLPKRLLVIHGLGGAGKSTLLKMYGLFCHKHHIPVALVASEEATSSVDVLEDWADDLSDNNITLPTFRRTLTHYRAIQAQVEAEAKKSSQAVPEFAGTMGIAAARAAVGMALSAIPIVGPLAGALGGESIEAFLGWLHSFLSKPDLELYLDPARRLTADFLHDLAHVAAQQRIVLMTDTYEQMTTQDNWMRDFARQLPKNVLLVIAGRAAPEWDRAWPEWMGKAEVVELKEMTPEDLRTLVYRYYTYIRSGDPDPEEVETIVQFARGLPMVATTVVQLWVKYGAQDFQTVRPHVVADLADRLLEGVSQEMRPAFEAAAVLRYFNVEALHALLDGSNAETLYAELRRWPFIRSRREGLAVHDTMREMINEALQMRTPERFRTLHERAAGYYETLLKRATGDERERYASEQLYHSVLADEDSAMQLFQEIAEELTRYRLMNRLRALLNDVNIYPLKRENSWLWREYYNTRLAHLEGHIQYAEEVYQAIAEKEGGEAKLRAYALCDWGGLLCRRERIRQPGMEEKAVHLLERSLNMAGSTDVKLAIAWVHLSDICIARSDWDKALFYLEQPRRFFTERGDHAGLLTTLYYERGVYGRQGNLRKMIEITQQMRSIYAAVGEPPAYLRTQITPSWEWLWAGRYAEAEEEFRVAIEIARSLQDQEFLCSKIRDLGLCLGLQGRCSHALALAEEGLALARSFGSRGAVEVDVALIIYGSTCYKCGKFDEAVEYLTEAITEGKKIRARLDPAPLHLATVYEVMKRYDEAEYLHQFALSDAHQTGRNYFKCGALSGLMRVKYARSEYGAVPPLFAEAEQLAQQYEYNDYLTSLYLTRGHITWENHIPEWGEGFDSILGCYKHALIYAMRYGRYLLDETLIGREHETPVWPIIPHCLQRGEAGRSILVALRDWWQAGINETDTPRPDTISLISEGIPLLEAEGHVRSREPGDGSPQVSVANRINAAFMIAQDG